MPLLTDLRLICQFMVIKDCRLSRYIRGGLSDSKKLANTCQVESEDGHVRHIVSLYLGQWFGSSSVAGTCVTSGKSFLLPPPSLKENQKCNLPHSCED